MRILIDATPLLVRSAGVKNFVYYWLSHLKKQSVKDEIAFFPFLRDLGRLDHQESVSGWLATFARLQLMGLLNGRDNQALDLLVSRRYDLFHASQLVRNPPRKCKVTATIYDMTCWLMPEMHTDANVAATKEYAERILRHADGLIAISESTRQDSIRILGLREDSIRVIYPGVSDAFFQVTEPDIEGLRQKYAMPDCYLVFVGCIEPRKNLTRILDAWDLLPLSTRADCQLVAIGPLGWEKSETTARLLGGGGGVRYLGYVPEEDLPALMAGATALVYPSYYEGFGFPVVQAMAVGTPVITSGVSSLPEIAGDAALFVNPHCTGEISDALRQVLSSASLCQALRARGTRRAEQFRWSRCAKMSLNFFNTIAGGD
jgi:glycosyltransferase involved in cell wall biosynthesis